MFLIIKLLFLSLHGLLVNLVSLIEKRFNKFLLIEYVKIDWCSTHAGQGFDYHYHGDPFGSNCMYSASDYNSSVSHPPLIGFALDGFYIYGRYLDDQAPGYNVPLDACGGHIHSPDPDGYGYHYHTQVLSQTLTADPMMGFQQSTIYTANIAASYQCELFVFFISTF